MKDIEGYEGLYAITEEGKVWCYPRQGSPGKFRKTNKNNKGYVMIGLWKKCLLKNCTVHRLVAKTYIPNPLNLPQVNHKDGNKENNHFSNLEWCTNQQNRDHALKRGLHWNWGVKHS